MSNALIWYRGQKVAVSINSYFMGGTGLIFNVTAVAGYPFMSADAESQGKTFGAWNCNGLRVCEEFIHYESIDQQYFGSKQ